ncbi:MAG: hypothetical protein IKV27_04025 [Lachnospiraceae bacterium]|nr:hypothetical protein [Lachnospiraceae bacterium]
MNNSKVCKRILSFVLASALIVSLIQGRPFAQTVSAATGSTLERVADQESIDYWKGYFSNGDYDSNVWSSKISTQNAGAIWTDKSVFVPNSTITIDGVNVPIADTGDNFLISMSVMASNKTVRGYEYIPTSTMLVLDVSASMGNGYNGNSSWDEMVEAANKAIDTLLNLNKNNHVGVVLYSGNTQEGSSNLSHSTLLLPLDRYTTTATNNNGTWNNTSDDYPEYLTASNSSVGVNSAVRPSGNYSSKSVTGGTYIQGGIYRAMEELVSDDAPKKVTEGVQAGMAYTPIIVLMSDGAPTAANLDYDFNDSNNNNHATDIGDGTSTDERIGFLTQLTAAYAKARIDGYYEKDMLFYTLGLGLDDLNATQQSIAEAVLDPSQNSGNMNTYWNRYLALDNDPSTQADNTMYLNSYNNGTGYNAVVKNDYVTRDYKNYVTQYFEAVATLGTSLEQALLNAFQQIVDTIVIQSVYYPTEIGGNSADLGGYVTFRDELGEYIDVVDVKGFLFEDVNGNQVLHTGSRLAENFVSGGGDLGQSSNPKPLGEEFVHAVKERIGIADTSTAQNLIRNAYYYKQLFYESDDNFSNYIGWYGDIDGKFVDFWHEGHTEAEINVALNKGAKFIYKSYGYLGEVNEDHGIKASDMMYTVIRVRKTIAADVEGTSVGEIVVEGAIPASLVPTITYEVELQGTTYETGVQSVEITDTSAKFPARLLYEVALRSDINPINIAEKVNDAHKNQNGTYTFYTNDWKHVNIEAGEFADTSVNAFTHFEPSHENERYYYLTDSVVYSDANGTVYTGANKPSGDGYYHENRVFSVENGNVSSEVTYIKTSSDALSHCVQVGNQWVIPAGTGKHEIVGYEVPLKNNNYTGTNRFTAYAKIKTDAENSSGVHTSHYSVVTFGNNGRLTVTPATGIKLSKTLDVASDTIQTFEFKISGAGAEEDYIVTPLNADGSFGTGQTVTADAYGVITVNLEAGKTVYVTGLVAGTYTVTESAHDTYRVLTINNQEAVSNSIQVNVVEQKTTAVDFVNTLQGFGSLYITKEVVSGVQGQVPPEHATGATFDITVDVGVELARQTFEAAHSDENTSLTQVTVGDDGKISGLSLKHGETIVIRNLPEGTNAVVTEALTAVQANNYVVSYFSHNKAGDSMDDNGAVTIVKDANATVIVNNAYKPVETSVTIGFDGTKFMKTANLQQEKKFSFTLEKYENGNWITVKDWNEAVTVSTGDNEFPINFDQFKLNLSYDKPGTHSYRVYEKDPGVADGINYDPSIYSFVVAVVDNNGQLEASVEGNCVSRAGNEYIVTANFENAYNVAPVIIDILKKVVDPTKEDVLLAGYEFELYAANDSWVYTSQDLIGTDVSDAKGEARFSWFVDSTKVGEYHYILKEKVPAGYTEPAQGEYGWDYDTDERRIIVDVSSGNASVSVDIESAQKDQGSGKFVFENKYTADSVEVPLNVTKTLVGRDMEAGEFTFELVETIGNNSVRQAVGKNAAGVNGRPANIIFYKVDGNNNETDQEFKLEYDKVGTHHYKISEVPGNLGGVTYTSRIFDLVVEVTDDGEGALQARYYYEDSTSNTINFTNAYSITTPVSVEFEATKKLTGDRQMLSSEFHFNVYEMTDNTFSTKKYQDAVATGSNIGAIPNASGVAESGFKFTKITYDEPGVHYYQISEVDQGNDLGITYDKTSYNVTVTVTDKLDGTMEVATSVDNQELVFTNKYEPRSISYNFVADKVLTGRTLADGEFAFALYEADVNVATSEWTAGAKVGEDVENAANGDIVFPEVTFDSKGTYHYIVKEVGGNLGGIIYDDTEFYVTFTVTDDFRGNLSVETVITDDEGNLSQIIFNNDYATEHAKVVIEATKILDNRPLAADEFVFELVSENGSVYTAKNDAAGLVKFEELSFDTVGIYKYTLTEKKGSLENVTYSEETYNVTIKVMDNLLGHLVAEVEYAAIDGANNESIVSEATFTNIFTPDPSAVIIDATKQLTGRDLAAGEFRFVIKDETGNELATGTNTADGKIYFTEFKLPEGNDYKLYVSEVDTAAQHVFYDGTTYMVLVDVTNNGSGILKVTVEYPEGGIVFKNEYKEPIVIIPDPEPQPDTLMTSFAFHATKVLKGRSLIAGEFLFLVKDSNGEVVATGTNAVNGSVQFSPLVVFTPGRYVYTVSEINTGALNITYDTTVYTVIVDVEQVGGELAATINYPEGGLIFRNYVGSVPATGDATPIGLLIALVLLSGAGVAGLLILKRKKK